MPSKVYVSNYPAGDFRAMPAIGDGHALLKWVTSFPGNPARGLPTVTGLVLLSDAEDGRLLAVLDAAAVTALRTAAAGVLAADTLCRSEASSYAVVGAGVNGAEAARMLVAHGVTPLVWDVDEARRQLVADRLGARAASSAAEALACEVVITVTPGAEVLYPAGSLEAGQHVSLMGADGPGKAEVAIEELAPRAPLLRRLGAGEPRWRAHRGRRRRRRASHGRHRAREQSSSATRTAAGARETSRSSTRPASRSKTWRSRRSLMQGVTSWISRPSSSDVRRSSTGGSYGTCPDEARIVDSESATRQAEPAAESTLPELPHESTEERIAPSRHEASVPRVPAEGVSQPG